MKKAFVNSHRIYGTHGKDVERVSGKDMANLPSVENGFIVVEDGIITEIDSMDNFYMDSVDQVVDLEGELIFPCYCDSHTHIVFAEAREREFEMKISGMTYEEIAAAGGGIVNSAMKLRETPLDDLYESAYNRAMDMIAMGTGAIEIKSGYGLSIDAELKMLKVIKKLNENLPIPIVATYLGAHAVPPEYKSNPNDYIEKEIFPTLEAISKEHLADYVDIFIERNYFSIEMANKILDEAEKYNLRAKLHVNQLSNMGGVQLGVDRNALSVDHLEEMSTEEIEYLNGKETIGTLLPSCSFFLRIPYAPARDMINSGLPISLASDYNPGSTPSGNMNFVVSLSCIYQRLLPSEAINAATINAAYAMNLINSLGSITKGKIANFFTIPKECTAASIPYSFGKPIISSVYINGEKFLR